MLDSLKKMPEKVTLQQRFQNLNYQMDETMEKDIQEMKRKNVHGSPDKSPFVDLNIKADPTPFFEDLKVDKFKEKP